MGEIIHLLEHSLGFCGEKHTSLLTVILEWNSFSHFFSHIKNSFK